ncbi:MAG: MiaB/RimO family radical SAM methylthiotransferase [Coriobacteriia bacterium]|nr:MiaB/RimO family radical SAM methylthiotransferase [Coriobacteriia bacterium]
MRFCCVNLGCKVNRVETDAVAAWLINEGNGETTQEDADLIIVNTCTVTGEADKKTRKAVRHALRVNDHAQVVVTGCAAAIDAEFYEGLDPRVEFVPKGQLMDRTFEQAHVTERARVLAGDAFRTRVGVKVQDGCNNACTYCIVHVARGKSVSRPSAQIVEECVALADAGVREIVLSGINLGSYCEGQRRDPDALRLPSLLRQILESTAGTGADGAPRVRYRIGSVEPRDVTPELMELMAANPERLCRHLHLPLQSGSYKVLKEMARPYDAAFFTDLVERFHEQVPGMALSTDVIVGFPGETEEDFQQTLNVCRACGFMKIHVFPYSLRAGTPAAERTDQIAPEVKADRAARLRALSDELAAADQARRAGTTEWALVEGPGRATVESYHEVTVGEDVADGDFVLWSWPCGDADD